MAGEAPTAGSIIEGIIDGARALAAKLLAEAAALEARWDLARAQADLAAQEATTLPPAPAPAPAPASIEVKKADPPPVPAAPAPSRATPPPLPPRVPMQPPGRGERFYAAYRKAKGGRTRTGAVMGQWTEMSADFQRAYTAAGESAAQGKTPAECYGIYLAARNGTAFDGLPAPAWTGLQDQDAWTAAADALRLG